jgi:hypothetical protein
MNLESEILKEHSRRNADRIAAWVGRDRKRLGQVTKLLLAGEYVVAQRAAWVVGICSDRHPDLIAPYLSRLVSRMQEPEVHDAVKRNVVRILQTAEIPKHLLGTVASVCFEYLSDPYAPIAVRACSMTVLARIAKQEPDIGKELRLVIEQHLPYGTGAFQSRARQVLKHLEPGSRRGRTKGAGIEAGFEV